MAVGDDDGVVAEVAAAEAVAAVDVSVVVEAVATVATVATTEVVSEDQAEATEKTKEDLAEDATPEPKRRGRKRKVDADAEASPAKPAARRGRKPNAVRKEEEAATASPSANGTADASADAESGAGEKEPKGDGVEEEGEETESEPERAKPKAKRAKKVVAGKKGTPPRKKPGKKVVEEEEEDEDDNMDELVAALPESIRARYGEIVWVRMRGFPYWPALIMDPRQLDGQVRESALKDLDSRYVVRFYVTNNFNVAMLKMIEPWTDTKFNYREGYPVKDAKAPKRREKLIQAITQADAEISLPIVERMDGILKPEEPSEEEESEPAKPPTEEQPPVVEKRKRGRPRGSKNKPKVPGEEPKVKAKRGRKKKADSVNEVKTAVATADKEPEAEEVEATPDEDATSTPTLSKEEIKAKIASRKAPSRKKPKADGSVGASTKKVSKTGSTGRTEGKSTSEMDVKRKKEIELVVPHKTVKSADIREATEEAARKKFDRKDKMRDKIQYQVGDLAHFARRMSKLYANESSNNNDELIRMLAQLLEETKIYRSDAERSGLAPIIAAVRKSSNPTVAQTASGVRKHLMKILNNDVVSESAVPKKHKSDVGNDIQQKKKRKTDEHASKSDSATGSDGSSPKEVKPEVKEQAEKATIGEPAVEAQLSSQSVSAASSPPDESEKPSANSSPAAATTDSAEKKADENHVDVESEPSAQASPSSHDNTQEQSEPAKSEPEQTEPEQTARAASPASSLKGSSPTAKALDPSSIKSRKNCTELLSKILEPNGSDNTKLAQEIEQGLFDRYTECNNEYRSHARKIVFGLRDHPAIRARLVSGTLHALELVYNSELFDTP